MKNNELKWDELDFIMTYENGKLTNEELINGFQHLIDNGHAWTLQGCYGRTAQKLIDRNLCHYSNKFDDKKDSITIFEGKCEGTLVQPKEFSGNPSLPYDCVFVPNGTNKTYAQIRNTKESEKYLYRIQALKKFLNWYK